jgi:hypothetical protein
VGAVVGASAKHPCPAQQFKVEVLTSRMALRRCPDMRSLGWKTERATKPEIENSGNIYSRGNRRSEG